MPTNAPTYNSCIPMYITYTYIYIIYMDRLALVCTRIGKYVDNWISLSVVMTMLRYNCTCRCRITLVGIVVAIVSRAVIVLPSSPPPQSPLPWPPPARLILVFAILIIILKAIVVIVAACWWVQCNFINWLCTAYWNKNKTLKQ